MPHPVRYARTSDGVNVAYCEFGEGDPLIYLSGLPWSNFSYMFSNPYIARHPQELGGFARVLPYDPRGCGLSDHDAPDLSLEGFARDIDAVADTAGHQRFTLYGSGDATRVAIHYAATRPERVAQLILWLPSVSTERLRNDPVLRAISPLVDRDWNLYARTLAHAVVGGWDATRAPYADAFAELVLASIRQEEFRPLAQAMWGHDVSDELAQVEARTLVMTRERAAVYTLPVVSEVAAGIPGAHLTVTPGNWLLPCTGDDITSEIATFLGHAPPTPAPPPFRVSSAELEGPVGPGSSHGASLTHREREVIALIAQGKTNAEIGTELVIARATASRHVHNILGKLGVSRRSEAAVYAVVEGLNEAPPAV